MRIAFRSRSCGHSTGMSLKEGTRAQREPSMLPVGIRYGRDRRSDGRRRQLAPADRAPRSAGAPGARGARGSGVQADRGSGRRRGDPAPRGGRARGRHGRRDAPSLLSEPAHGGRGGLRRLVPRRLPLGRGARGRGRGQHHRAAAHRGRRQAGPPTLPLGGGAYLCAWAHRAGPQGHAPEPEPLRQLLRPRALAGGVSDAGGVPGRRRRDPPPGGRRARSARSGVPAAGRSSLPPPPRSGLPGLLREPGVAGRALARPGSRARQHGHGRTRGRYVGVPPLPRQPGQPLARRGRLRLARRPGLPARARGAAPARVRRRPLGRLRAAGRRSGGQGGSPRAGHDEERSTGDAGRARVPRARGLALPPAEAARPLAAVRLRHLGARERALARGREGQAPHDRRDRRPHLGMTVVLDGNALTLGEVVRVARGREDVVIPPEALERMRETRALVELVVERGDEVYGVTTGVGARKKVRVPLEDIPAFNRALIANHRVAQGPEAPEDVVRATMLRVANALAKGTAGVRPQIGLRLVRALNEGERPRVRMLGSLGQADLPPLADLADELFGDVELAAKEGLALLNSNAFATALAALALADLERLLAAMDVAGALDLEAFAANLTLLHPAIGEVRPYPGIVESLDALRGLLEGSSLWEPGAARNLQDPLTFRCLPQVHGAVHLGKAPERERILQVPRGAGLPERASVEQRPEAGERRRDAGVGPHLADGGMEERE